MGPSRRATRRICIGLVIGVVATLTLLVWPGFITSYSCTWSIDPTTSVNGHSYCYETGHLPAGTVPSLNHYQAWGFEFSMEQSLSPAGPLLNIWISEPSGPTIYGSVGAIGPTNSTTASSWFTSDGAAGISFVWQTENFTLYVEK